MKARVKATGKIIEVYPSIHKGCDYDGSDGYSYVKEDIIILDNDPDYWTRLEHQYAGMAMQALLSSDTMLEVLSRRTNGAMTMEEEVAGEAFDYAHALMEKMKEERK